MHYCQGLIQKHGQKFWGSPCGTAHSTTQFRRSFWRSTQMSLSTGRTVTTAVPRCVASPLSTGLDTKMSPMSGCALITTTSS